MENPYSINIAIYQTNYDIYIGKYIYIVIKNMCTYVYIYMYMYIYITSDYKAD